MKYFLDINIALTVEREWIRSKGMSTLSAIMLAQIKEQIEKEKKKDHE